MRTLRILRLLAALAALAGGVATSRGEPDDDAGVHLGMDEAGLRQDLGEPSGVLAAGSTRILHYPDFTFTFRQGVLARIEPRTAAPAAAPGPDPSAADEAPPAAPSRFHLDIDADTRDQHALREHIHQLLAAEDYAALAALADRTSRERTTFGDGGFQFFYLAFDCCCSPQDSPETWERQSRRLRAWTSRYPTSSAARLCHVCFDISYAWAATAGGPATLDNPTVLSMIRGRLKDAEAVLEEARALEPGNPFYLTFALELGQARLGLAHTETRSKLEIFQLFNTEKMKHPDVWTADTSLVLYLHTPPNVDGDWERICDQEVSRAGSVGIEGYARAVIFIAPYYQNLYRETKARRDLAMAGFRALVGKYPDSRYFWSEFALHAFLAGDHRAAREAFDHLNFIVHSDVFPTSAVAERIYRAVRSD